MPSGLVENSTNPMYSIRSFLMGYSVMEFTEVSKKKLYALLGRSKHADCWHDKIVENIKSKLPD